VQLGGTGIARFVSKIPKCALFRGDRINVAHYVVPHVKWPFNVFQLNLTTSNRHTIYLVLRNCTGKLLFQETCHSIDELLTLSKPLSGHNTE